MDITTWLLEQGLERYQKAFDENGIDADILPHLTTDDLTDMGITSVGHRRKLLRAIEGLRPDDSVVRAQRPDTDPESARSAERRQMTLLFCDIASSTEAVSQIDPEESREVISAFVDAVEATASAQRGYVAKFLGDGALVYFGYPAALENNAEAAVRAGLQIISAAKGLKWPDGSPLQVRVGVATGRVVVGDVIGHGSAREVNVVGETAHLASRLQTLANPGQLLIDDRTRRMLGDLMLVETLGLQSLKGFNTPVAVWNVTGPKVSRSRFVALRAGRMTSLLGRDADMTALRAACATACEGQRAVVTIRGEPGIGKSRVAHELSDLALANGMQVMSWFCSPNEVATAFAPIVGHYAAGLDNGHDSARTAQLAAVLLPVNSDAAEVSALFERLLNLPAIGTRLRDYSPPRLRRRTIEVILEQLCARASKTPLLLVVEDYQWIDPSTAELLEALVAQASHWPLLVVTTYRSEIADPWQGVEDVLRVQLDRIDDETCADLVRRVAEPATLTETQTNAIVAKADGVPLFIEELTRAVLDQDGDSVLADVPDTLSDALMARVDRLGGWRHTIQTAALLGRDFDRGLLARVLGRDPDTVTEMLGSMEQANIVSRAEGAHDGLYRFQHALIQDVLADGLLRNVRAEMHRKIASVLVSDLEQGALHSPERVAGHYERGANPMAAMDWYITAGRMAVERFANREAVSHLDKALALSAVAPTTKVRVGAELGISGLKGMALTMMYGWSAPEVGKVYRRAYDLWDVAGGAAETFPTAIGLLSYSIVRGDFGDALKMAENALRIAESVQNIEWIMAAEHEYGALLLYKGDIAGGLTHLERCWDLYDPETHHDHMQYTGKNQGLFCLYHLGLAANMLGHATKARKLTATGIEMTATGHNAFTLCATMLAHPALLASLRDADAVLDHIDPALGLAAQEGFPHMIAQGLCVKGWALCRTGQTDEGLAMLGEGTAMWRGMGAGLRLSHYLGNLAEGHLFAGNVAAGLAAAEDALDVANRTGEFLQVADVLRIKADLMVLAGAPFQACELAYREAIALAERLDTHFYRWRAEARLGKLLLDHGRDAEGTALIQAAIAQFQAAEMPWEVAETRALLAAE